MKILLLGCGNIGKALLSAWSREDVLVVQPSLSCAAEFPKAQFIADLSQTREIDFKPDIIVCAIKPQMFNCIADRIGLYIKDSLFVSVMAGVKINRLEFENNRAVRIMPNIAIQAGHSVNLSVAGEKITDEDVAKINAMLDGTGLTVWLNTEEQLDFLTTIFGSGPAYVYLFMELMVSQTVNTGVDLDTATAMVRELLAGCACTNGDFEGLRKSVTSKGGCTEVALKVLKPSFDNSMKEAIKASLTRLNELNENRN
ncbi:MAG: NAD(P)-binding domain-containing protein [Prevotellaceae bacterium]|jgi:pyrroline-5-carboxylate reductase|nr:NAD(P)-binding domain-containing protein [Prevotellaceae bacterium]